MNFKEMFLFVAEESDTLKRSEAKQIIEKEKERDMDQYVFV